MKLDTLLNIDKIVIQSGKQLTITATIPDKRETIDYLAERKGKALSCQLDEVQRELGVENTLVDLRLPEGTIRSGPGLTQRLDDEIIRHFDEAEGITLRERAGYPYLVAEVRVDDTVSYPIVIDFPALVSWIYENEKELLALMEGELPDEPEPEQRELFKKEGFAVKLSEQDGYLVAVQVDDAGVEVEKTIANLRADKAAVFESIEKAGEWLILARKLRPYPDAEIVETDFAVELPEPGLSQPEAAEPVEEGSDSGD